MIDGIDESLLKSWIEDSLRDNSHILAAGYQGKTLLYQDNSHQIVIKTPHGSGLVKYIHTLLLRHEHRVYQQLAGFEGTPRCYGLIDNRFLALQYIDGKPIRQQRPENENDYFDKLFELVQRMHALGVAHTDLKRKDNLLITGEDQPCMIDFGTAVIKKRGFHPLNAYLYNLAVRFDYNAWVKHKYHNKKNISEADSMYFRRTFIERLASRIKKTYRALLPFKTD